ncbi:hypothetical protein F5Y09DRAFT_354131 [Xylaria sp. FL1042]|nr:hypothetical protein F5Y09DRAFT_354131 [Xylaria sp. FL1042]
MLYSSLFLLPAFELLVQATESHSPASMPSRRRQLTTCDQTYGNGSIPCGGPESELCYNPNLGQTCCKLDGGFCNAGSYCAPVAGYCCLKDEDLTTCAERAGFALPNSAVNDYSENSVSAVVAPARVSRTFTVTPFLTAHPGPTPVNTPGFNTGSHTEPFEESMTHFLTEFTVTVRFSTACHATPSYSAPAVAQVANASTWSSSLRSTSASSSARASASVSSIIQVSTAAKAIEGQIGSILAIVVGGVFPIILAAYVGF